MQSNKRGDFYLATGEGGATCPETISKGYSSPVSPVRLNSTTFSADPQQRIVNSSSGSFVKFIPSPFPKSARSFPRSSIKQVRYDTQRPTELEPTWHPRSFSEHSCLNQNTRPQVGFNDLPTVFPKTVSSQSDQQGDLRWTPSGYITEAQSEPLRRRISRPNDLPHVSSVSSTAENMYSQISAMTQLQSRGPRSPAKCMPFSRRGSNVDSSGITFHMYVNGVEQSGLRSNSDTIKRRLLLDYELNRQKEAEDNEVLHTLTAPPYPAPPYFKELASLQARRGGATNTLGRHRNLRRRSQVGTVYIPLQPVNSSMTRSEYNDRIMDYRGNSALASRVVPGGGGGINDYSLGSISAVTSPTIARGSIRSTEQASPNSVIEELQGRFQTSTRSGEKRPILKNASVNADYVTPVYQRRRATASTATATLASRPHHRSELALPTTTAGSFEQPLRSINAASTVRLDPDPNGTLRAAGSSAYRGGPSFRRLQTLYGTNISQKRFPSDNALDMTYPEGKPQQPSSLMPQFYVSGRKAGTVKIQVRSRSEQASPTNGPPSSPRQAFRVASVGGGVGVVGGGVAFDDRIRSKQVILPQTAPAPPQLSSRNPNTSSSVDGPQTEDEENLVLPSVREIIRQVEEMTLKNNSTHNSTTSLSRRQHHLHQQTANPGSPQHMSRSVVRPMNADQHGGASNRSHSASSILTNGGSLSRMINHDGVYHSSDANSADFYNDSFGKGYSTTRKGDIDSDGRRNATNSAFHVARKGEQITNLPQDYQKLLEAFLEQRREIQRLRKEMVDKDRLIATLEKDIHMYEPWR